MGKIRLIILLALLSLSLNAQRWEFAGRVPTDTILVQQGDTLVVNLGPGGYNDSSDGQIRQIQRDSSKFVPDALNELYRARLGFFAKQEDGHVGSSYQMYFQPDTKAFLTPMHSPNNMAAAGTWQPELVEGTVFAGADYSAGAQIILVQTSGAGWYSGFDLLLSKDQDPNAGGGGATNLGGLSDVTLSSLSSGDVLQWNGTTFENVQAYTHDLIWAEENGGIANNTREYSFGNGATGNDNFGIPIWQDMELVGMVVNAETSGTSASFTCTINATDIAQSVTATGTTTVSYFPSVVSVSQGDLLNFKTLTISGTWTDVRVGVIVKQPIIFD